MWGNTALPDGVRGTSALPSGGREAVHPTDGLTVTESAPGVNEATAIPEATFRHDDTLGNLMRSAFNLTPPAFRPEYV